MDTITQRAYTLNRSHRRAKRDVIENDAGQKAYMWIEQRNGCKQRGGGLGGDTESNKLTQMSTPNR